MPTTPKINLVQNKTNKHDSNKEASTIQSARLTVPPTSNKKSINNSDCSAQGSNMNIQRWLDNADFQKKSFMLLIRNIYQNFSF